MPAGPADPALVVYWLPTIGIGKPLEKVHVPLLDMLDQTRSDGSPQVSVAILSSATFLGIPETFAPPYLELGEGLSAVLTPHAGDIHDPVRQLQARGVKVLLGVVCARSMGWDHVSAAQNGDFAQWVRTEILEKYSLDGIDIDDECCDLEPNPRGLVDTVAALRVAAPQALISKALWQDSEYFTLPVSPTSPWLPGSYLGQMLDFASTMNYGDGVEGLESFVQSYTQFEVGGQNVGMAPSQLCIGVQAGVGPWMTPLAVTAAVSEWVVAQGYRGIMLYTYSQDIQQWTHQPQNSPGYLFPNPNDHEWQKVVVQAMGVGGAVARPPY